MSSGDANRGRLLFASITEASTSNHMAPLAGLEPSTSKGSSQFTAHASSWSWEGTSHGLRAAPPKIGHFMLASAEPCKPWGFPEQLSHLQEEAISFGQSLQAKVSAHLGAPLGSFVAALESAQTAQHRLPLPQLTLPWLVTREHKVEEPPVQPKAQDNHQLAAECFRMGLQLQAVPDPAAAAAHFAQAAALEPDNPLHYSYWSKQLTDSSYQDERSEQKTRETNEAALAVASRCNALPGGPYGVCLVAECVAKGRLALVVDSRTRVKLAVESHAAAVAAISADPEYDVAHHLLGRWHYEMAHQNMFVRMLVKLFFNTDLPPGTEAEAADCFRRAAQLRPDRLIHKVELARCVGNAGKREEAIQLLKEAAELDCEDINAVLCKQEIAPLLRHYSQEHHGWFHFR